MIVLLAVVAIYSLSTNSLSHSQGYLDGIKRIQKAGLLETDYNQVIQYLVTNVMEQLRDGRAISINETYDPEKINIYVLKSSLHEVSPSREIEEAFFDLKDLCSQNMVAIPGNILLIDSKFFGFLLLSAINAFNASQFLPITALDRAHISNVGQSYLRLQNIHALNDPSIWHRDLEEVCKGVNQKVMDSGTLLGSITLDELKLGTFLYKYFLFVISHELAHLRPDVNTPQNWLSIEDLIETVGTEKFLREENYADSIATRSINSVMKRTYGNPDEIKEVHIAPGDMAYYAFAATLRDLILYKSLDGFNGQNAANILTTFIQKIPHDVDPNIYNFTNPIRLEGAYFNRFPLVTEEEWYKLTKEVRTSYASLRHSHLFDRVYDYLWQLNKYTHLSMVDITPSTILLGYDYLFFFDNKDTIVPDFIPQGIEDKFTLSEESFSNVTLEGILWYLGEKEILFTLKECIIPNTIKLVSESGNVIVELWLDEDANHISKIIVTNLTMFRDIRGKQPSDTEMIAVLQYIIPNSLGSGKFFDGIELVKPYDRSYYELSEQDRVILIESVNESDHMRITIDPV